MDVDTLINKEDLAWAAGFLDGEGCFIVRPNAASGEITVHNVFWQPIDRLAAIFQCGTVSFEGRRRAQTRNTFRWRCHGASASWVSQMLCDSGHLTSKLEQALSVARIRTYPRHSRIALRLREVMVRFKLMEYNEDRSPRR